MRFTKTGLAILSIALLATLFACWIEFFITDDEPISDTHASSMPKNGDLILNDASSNSLGSIHRDSFIPSQYIEYNKEPQNTPVGTDVTISFPIMSVDFQNIIAEGTTSVLLASDNPLNTAVPEGYTPIFFFDITTTSTYTGNIRIEVEYIDSVVENEDTLSLFHWNGTCWENVSIFVDRYSNIIHGNVNSLSWFFIGGQWVWIEDSIPAHTMVMASSVILLDKLMDYWITDHTSVSSSCPMDKQMSVEVTQCGEELWPIWEWIMMDSVVSWKYWMPPAVDVLATMASTNVVSP